MHQGVSKGPESFSSGRLKDVMPILQTLDDWVGEISVNLWIKVLFATD